jgi:hypothetical protein
MCRAASSLKIAMLFMIGGASAAPPASALTREQLNRGVELRIMKQPLAILVQTLMQNGGVPFQIVGEVGEEVADWRFKGTFAAALKRLSSEFGLCLYSDGTRLFVINPALGEHAFVAIDGPLGEAQKVFRSSFPWYSANAVKVDIRSNALRLCGPTVFLQPSIDALKFWGQNRVVIIRYRASPPE